MNLTLQSRLLLVPVEIRQDKKHFIVEDKASGEFYEMSEVCIDAINLINQGMRLEEIERTLKGKYPNEEVNLLVFAEQLIDLELIDEIDGVKVEINKKISESFGCLWISPKIGKFFFNKVSLIVYAVLFSLNIYLFISHPTLLPRYKDLFVFDFMLFNILFWLLLTFILVFIHELGHILAMRSHNLPTKLEVGHRLFLVVLETDMSSVWKLHSNERNVLFLAGLCFDTLILSFALLSQLFFANGSGIFLSIMNVVVLDTFIRMVYQMAIYMKTDLYYVFENVSGCYNLMENAQQSIRKWFPFQQTEANSGELFDDEKNTVFIYSIFYISGVFVTLSLFVFFYIPQLLYAWKKIFPGFSESPTALAFWDAVLFSLQVGIFIMLLLYSWRKKYLQH